MRLGLAALTLVGLVACKPAGGSGAVAGAPSYACVSTFAGKTASCMRFSNVAGGAAGVDRLKQGCLVVPGQSWSAACPADALVGCCKMKQPDGAHAETCFYKDGPLIGSPEQCVNDGGVWSAAP